MSQHEMRLLAAEHADSLADTINQINRLVALDERGETAGEELREELGQRPLDIEVIRTIRVTIGTGGPAYGVDFRVDSDGHMIDATAWHQDWFEEKGHAPLDDETADELWNVWYLDSAIYA